MQHLHDEALTLLALGEEPTPEESEHLRACACCSEELESYRRVVSIGRATAPAEAGNRAPATYPPASVWAGIHRELGLSNAVRQDPGQGQGQSQDQGQDRGQDPSRPGPAREETRRSAEADVVPLAGRRRRRRPTGRVWLAAAAASAVVAGAAVWGFVDTLNQGPETLAAVELAPLPAYSESGRAEVDELPDGRRELVVEASGTDAAGYREVWLLAPDASSMVSLGTMEGTEARFTLPADLDLAAYPVVDISDEPFDGNPAHSGDSILRGQLEL